MKNLEKMIMNVPIIKIEAKNNNVIYSLMEKYNLTGSIKIKTVYWILKKALEKRLIKEGSTIIEASSGNTAIAMAYFSKIFNYNSIIVLPKSTSKCKKRLIRSYNSEIIEVDGTTDACINVRDKIAGENPFYFVLNQFIDENNYLAHYNLTANHILSNIGSSIDYFFTGKGTAGTLIGTGLKLKESIKNVKVIAFNPIEKIEGLRNYKVSKTIIPFYEKYKNIIDEDIDVNFDDAISGIEYYINEGYFVGISSGAILKGTLDYLNSKNLKNKICVIIAPDGGDNYLDLILKYINPEKLSLCK